MLNYILPPIIIVICVSFLIIFLFKKAANLPQSDFEDDDQLKHKEKKMSALTGAAGQLGLKILERMMHKAKLMSLKFHNVSNDLFQSIREKRQQRTRVQQEIAERNFQDAAEARAVVAISKPMQEIRPTIGNEVTKPEKNIVEKNKLEDVLIKRIAINPRDIEAYERLGDYYLESKNYQDSLECFKQVLWLSPTHQKARLRIRRLQRITK